MCYNTAKVVSSSLFHITIFLLSILRLRCKKNTERILRSRSKSFTLDSPANLGKSVPASQEKERRGGREELEPIPPTESKVLSSLYEFFP